MTHSDIIGALGGTGAVAAKLGLNDSAVSMWRARSIPWRWRPRIAQLAEEAEIALPADFLDPDQEEAA